MLFAAVQTVQTTGVNIEGVLANAVVIVGFMGGVATYAWKRVRKGLHDDITEGTQPVVNALNALTERVDQLEAATRRRRRRRHG